MAHACMCAPCMQSCGLCGGAPTCSARTPLPCTRLLQPSSQPRRAMPPAVHWLASRSTSGRACIVAFQCRVQQPHNPLYRTPHPPQKQYDAGLSSSDKLGEVTAGLRRERDALWAEAETLKSEVGGWVGGWHGVRGGAGQGGPTRGPAPALRCVTLRCVRSLLAGRQVEAGVTHHDRVPRCGPRMPEVPPPSLPPALPMVLRRACCTTCTCTRPWRWPCSWRVCAARRLSWPPGCRCCGLRSGAPWSRSRRTGEWGWEWVEGGYGGRAGSPGFGVLVGREGGGHCALPAFGAKPASAIARPLLTRTTDRACTSRHPTTPPHPPRHSPAGWP